MAFVPLMPVVVPGVAVFVPAPVWPVTPTPVPVAPVVVLVVPVCELMLPLVPAAPVPAPDPAPAPAPAPACAAAHVAVASMSTPVIPTRFILSPLVVERPTLGRVNTELIGYKSDEEKKLKDVRRPQNAGLAQQKCRSEATGISRKIESSCGYFAFDFTATSGAFISGKCERNSPTYIVCSRSGPVETTPIFAPVSLAMNCK